MQKFSQKRSVKNWLKEKTNLSGWSAEKYFDPELLKVMNSLRKTDNDIRSIALGKQYDGGDPGSSDKSLKNLMKAAKSSINRRLYMEAVSELGEFHKKCSEINTAISHFKIDLNQVHHMFLFKKLEDGKKKKLKELHDKFAYHEFKILKLAGMADFFSNHLTGAGRARAAWEARYPKKVGELKAACSTILDISQSLYDNLLSSLDEMASARAERQPDNFEKTMLQFSKNYEKYNLTFKELYNKVLRPIINDSEIFIENKIEEVKDPGTLKEPESKDQKLPVVPDLEVYEQSQPRAPSGHQGIPEFRKQFPAAAKVHSEPGTHKDMSVVPGSQLPPQHPVTSRDISVAIMPSERDSKPVTREVNSPQTMRSPIIEGVGVKRHSPSVKEVPVIEKAPSTIKDPSLLDAHLRRINELSLTPDNSNRNPLVTQMSPGNQSQQTLNPNAHSKFLNSLESFSGESSLILSSYIKKYAIAIQESDPESSIKLFQIVNSIKG
tara:strand:- start:23349 stop:24830 length:1482 start_codon:yes stop_codon:yes gene_type:complete